MGQMSDMGLMRKLQGLPIALDDLPAPGDRWVASRKAQVVLAIATGCLSYAEACRRYDLTVEELNDWRVRFGLGGVHALRIKCRGRSRA